MKLIVKNKSINLLTSMIKKVKWQDQTDQKIPNLEPAKEQFFRKHQELQNLNNVVYDI